MDTELAFSIEVEVGGALGSEEEGLPKTSASQRHRNRGSVRRSRISGESIDPSDLVREDGSWAKSTA